jgi:hypothetical protein
LKHFETFFLFFFFFLLFFFFFQVTTDRSQQLEISSFLLSFPLPEVRNHSAKGDSFHHQRLDPAIGHQQHIQSHPVSSRFFRSHLPTLRLLFLLLASAPEDYENFQT